MEGGVEMKGDGWTDEGRKGRMRRNNRGGGGERGRETKSESIRSRRAI